MQIHISDEVSKRRSINLTIREDILQEAKELNLNASRAAEHGIVQAIRDARTQAWLEENRRALSAHNKRVEENGTLLTPSWTNN